MQIGLFFGSFNPIHIGHLAIANYMAEFTPLEQVWFVVSPQNPLKTKDSLLEQHHRLALVNEAIGDEPRFRASDIEFKLPVPSYTVNTLAHLHEKYPQHSFSLIMGADNLVTLDRWKNYEEILQHHDIYVYPRPGENKGKFAEHARVKITEAPLMEISATFIRKAIKEGHDIRYFLSPPVHKYIDEMNFYKK